MVSSRAEANVENVLLETSEMCTLGSSTSGSHLVNLIASLSCKTQKIITPVPLKIVWNKAN